MKKFIISLLKGVLISLFLFQIKPLTPILEKESCVWAETTQDSPSDHTEGKPEINWYRLGEKTPPIIASIINLILMIFILWYFARKPVREYFSERSKKIKEEIEESEKIKKEAEERFKTICEKMDKVQDEIQELKKQMLASAVAERERSIAQTRSRAEALKEGVLRRIELEKEMMLYNIKCEVAAEIIKRASEILKQKVTEKEHEKLITDALSEFAQYVEKTKYPEYSKEL